MINISRLFLWLCLTFIVANCQQLLPISSYQHDIAFPSIAGQEPKASSTPELSPSLTAPKQTRSRIGNRFHLTSIDDQQPIRQLSAGFNFNPPPPLPFLQSFPLNTQLLSGFPKNALTTNNFQRGTLFRAPLFSLFTPNTVKQRPETDGQQEEYRKYLKEEAEELEKEKNQNEITTDFTDFTTDSTISPQPTQKTFVKVNIQGKDYSYTT